MDIWLKFSLSFLNLSIFLLWPLTFVYIFAHCNYRKKLHAFFLELLLFYFLHLNSWSNCNVLWLSDKVEIWLNFLPNNELSQTDQYMKHNSSSHAKWDCFIIWIFAFFVFICSVLFDRLCVSFSYIMALIFVAIY